MIQHILFLTLTYIALLLQVTMREEFVIYSIVPSFPVAVLLLACLHSKSSQALIWAGLIGFFIDTVSRGELGVTMFCALLCTGVLPSTWFKKKKISLIQFSIRALILCSLLIFSSMILKQFLQGTFEPNSEFSLTTFGTCCYTVFIAMVLRQFGMIAQFFRRNNHSRIANQESAYI
jgi:rod shape-determining protein MreD